MALREKERIFDTNQAALYARWDAADTFGLRSMCSGDLVGNPMKSAIAAHPPDEHFVIRVDGRVKSHHRRFLDALREGLQLRDQFPQRDIKVRAMQTGGGQGADLH
jgi:hypothetical protein